MLLCFELMKRLPLYFVVCRITLAIIYTLSALYEKGSGTFPDNKVILGELKGEPELAKAMKKVSAFGVL